MVRFLLAAFLFLAWGCDSTNTEEDAQEASDKRKSDAVSASSKWEALPPWEQPDDAIAATVDEEQILKGDIMDWALLSLSRQGIDPDSDAGQKWLADNAPNITESLVTYRILRKQAEKETPLPSDEEIDKIVAEVLKRFKDQKALEEYLDKHKHTMSSYRESLRIDLQFQRFMNNRSVSFAGPEPTDEMVRDYYNKHRAVFDVPIPAAVSYREIFIYGGNPGTEEDWAKATARAELVAGLLKNGSDFIRLVKEYSQSATRNHDGLIPHTLKKDVPDPSLATALFNLKKGDVSSPIRTKYGFTIVKIEDVREPQVAKLDDKLAIIIRKSIKDERMLQGFTAWLNEEWKKHLIIVAGKVINDPSAATPATP